MCDRSAGSNKLLFTNMIIFVILYKNITLRNC